MNRQRPLRPGIWDGRSGWWYEDGLFSATYMEWSSNGLRWRPVTGYYCALEYKEWYLRAEKETLDAQNARLAALP